MRFNNHRVACLGIDLLISSTVAPHEYFDQTGYRLWYATGEPPRGHECARDLFVTTVTWKESDDGGAKLRLIGAE